MYRLIQSIAQCAHETAQKRGQDVSATGCMAAVGVEQKEYWQAIDEGHLLTDAARHIREAVDLLKDGPAFVEYYDAHLHNTEYDELADLVITAATWYYTAKDATDAEDFDATRSVDVMLASGVLCFVLDRISAATQMATAINGDILRQVVNLKLRYNSLR